MDEITLLRRVREDVPGPDDATLAGARQRLMTRATSAGRSPRARSGLLWAASAALVLAVVAGVVLWPGRNGAATAAELLRDASASAGRHDDPRTAPGEYLEVVTREHALGYVMADGGGVLGAYVAPSVQTTWVPHTRSGTWVSQSYSLRPSDFFGGEEVRRSAMRDHAESATPDRPTTERAAGGAFGNGELGGGESDLIGVDDLEGLPRDPRTLLDRLARAHTGAETSRSDKVMLQVGTLLRSGLVPHDLRAAMYDALALLPDVVITDDQASLDGRTGTAIGVRTASGREMDEVLIDPGTGDYLGQRQTQLVDVGAVPSGTVMDSTSVSVRVVDRAP